MCSFVSARIACFGARFSATTPDPKKGSIHLARSSGCHRTLRKINGTSLVLMPWHFTGGTPTREIILGKDVIVRLRSQWPRLLHRLPLQHSRLLRPLCRQAGDRSHILADLRRSEE